MNLGQLIAALVDVQGKIGAHAKVRVMVEDKGHTHDFAATSVVYDDRAVVIAHEKTDKKEMH
jgi:hypothetical protein